MRQPASGSPVPADEQEAVWASLERRAADIRSLRGEATFLIGGAVFGGRGRVALLVKSPLDFRFDHLSDFGFLEHQVISQGGDFFVIWHPQNLYFQGIGSHHELKRYLSIALSTQDAVRFLLTEIPLRQRGDYEWRRGSDGTIVLKSDTHRILIMKKRDVYLPLSVSHYELNGTVDWRLEYLEYEEGDGVPYPRRLKGRFGASSLELLFKEVEINPPLSRRLFQAEIPRGAVRIHE